MASHAVLDYLYVLIRFVNLILIAIGRSAEYPVSVASCMDTFLFIILSDFNLYYFAMTYLAKLKRAN